VVLDVNDDQAKGISEETWRRVRQDCTTGRVGMMMINACRVASLTADAGGPSNMSMNPSLADDEMAAAIRRGHWEPQARALRGKQRIRQYWWTE